MGKKHTFWSQTTDNTVERCDEAVMNNQNSLCLDTMNWLCADSMERKLHFQEWFPQFNTIEVL